MSALGAIFRRDVALAWGAGGGVVAPLGFFLGATALVPLAIGTITTDAADEARRELGRALLQTVGPPFVWIAAALAILMTLERLFQADLEDGSLDQVMLSAAPFEFIVRCARRLLLALRRLEIEHVVREAPELVVADPFLADRRHQREPCALRGRRRLCREICTEGTGCHHPQSAARRLIKKWLPQFGGGIHVHHQVFGCTVQTNQRHHV